jgi:hypothetical protein
VAALVVTPTFYLLTQPRTLSLATPWGHRHPIDGLIQTAEEDFDAKLSKVTQTLPAAAAVYRKRRGRHPPPGFDKWYQFAARENGAVIVEDFWDQIYHDLEPFWGIDPAQIRKGAREFEMRIEVRDRKASTGSDWSWTMIWLDMIQTVEHLLPDMVLALNPMDEPRVAVLWEDIDRYLKKAAKTKKIVDTRSVVSEFTKLEEPDQEEERNAVVWENESKLTSTSTLTDLC